MWHLEQARGRWRSDGCLATVDLSQPDLGLQQVEIGGVALPDSVLNIAFPGEARQAEPLADAYVRQADLVATYVQTPDRTVRPQLYWRGLESDDSRFGFELVLSVQTSLLDSEPLLRVSQTVREGELLLCDGGPTAAPVQSGTPLSADTIVLCRWPAAAHSLAVAIFPTDFHLGWARVVEGVATAEWSLFPSSLEKGVIRRGRLRAIFVPRADDIASAGRVAAELASAAPPLGT